LYDYFRHIVQERTDSGIIDVASIALKNVGKLQRHNGSWENDIRLTSYITTALEKAQIHQGWHKGRASEYIVRAYTKTAQSKGSTVPEISAKNSPLGSHQWLSIGCRILDAVAVLGIQDLAEEIIQAIFSIQREEGFFGNPLFPPNFPWITGVIISHLADSGIDLNTLQFRKAVKWLLEKTETEEMWGKLGKSEDKMHALPIGAAFCLRALYKAGYGKANNTEKGIAWLLGQQAEDGSWEGDPYTTFQVTSALKFSGHPDSSTYVLKGLNFANAHLSELFTDLVIKGVHHLGALMCLVVDYFPEAISKVQ